MYRLADRASALPEHFFAVLNFAKIDPGPMQSPWVMEVDWVKHEHQLTDGVEPIAEASASTRTRTAQ